jgi:DNA polymerase III epsilon subunit-like protein
MREASVRGPPYRAGNGHEGHVINRAWSSGKAQKPASDQKWAEVCSGRLLQCAVMRAHDLRSLKGDRADSVAWARSLLQSGGFCVLDSETTGLTPPVSFVEIAIVDADAKVLFEGTVRPVCRIEASATRIHGHTARSLAGSPPFLEVYPKLLETLWGRRVIVYNASYDRRVWDAEVRILGARGALAGELLPESVP